MKKLSIISSEALADEVVQVARRLDFEPNVVVVDVNKLSEFSLSAITDMNVFIALESCLLGLPKKQLYREAVLRKFDLVNLISPSAELAGTVQLGSGIFVGNSCWIKDDCTIGNGAFVGSSSTLGVKARIGNFVTLQGDVQISSGVNISEHTFIGRGAKIQCQSVGKFCTMEKPVVYQNDIADMTHDLIGHRAVIRSVRYG